jgi:hypothetical protein
MRNVVSVAQILRVPLLGIARCANVRLVPLAVTSKLMKPEDFL